MTILSRQALRRVFGASGHRFLRNNGIGTVRVLPEHHHLGSSLPRQYGTTVVLDLSAIQPKSKRFVTSYQVLAAKPPTGFGKFTRKDDATEDTNNKETPAASDDKNPSEKGKDNTNETKDQKNDDDRKGFGRLMEPYTLIIIGIGSMLLLDVLDSGGLRNEITLQEFIGKYLMKGLVERIQIVNKEFCRCSLVTGVDHTMPRVVSFRIGSLEAFEQKLDDIQASMGIHPQDYIGIHYVNEVNVLGELKHYIPFMVVMMLLGLGLRKLTVRSTGGMDRFFRMGKMNIVDAKDVKVDVKFKDVAGMHEAKKEISEFVDFLKNPKAYEHYGAKIPKGALLCGAPGTGKTLLAKAVAGEANVPFYSISGSDFIEVFVGVGPSRVRDLFEKARKNAPAIVFIDEIDAVGKKRAKGGFSAGANDERENTLNQILVEMDGFKSSSGVIVLAGTNRADILDPALVRPGRFDRTITINKPDLDERFEIFKVHLSPIKLNKNLDMDDVARRLAALTPSFVGAEIANVSNEAAIQAVRRKSTDGVSLADFDAAIERVMAGLRRSNALLSPAQKLAVAYHEVGHALIGWWLEHADPVLKVSIIPRSSGALGFSQQLPDEAMLFSREALLDKVAVMLGGRAAEDIFIGRITTGATDDLNKVTRMCYAFVSQWGMNPALGLVSYQRGSGDEPEFYRTYSENTAQLIDTEVRTMIESQYARVKSMLREKAELVHKLSKLLYQRETITYHDIASCIGEREFPVEEKLRPYVLSGIEGRVEPIKLPETTGEAINEIKGTEKSDDNTQETNSEVSK
ncbi:ATP-dependent metalloprotease FtsH/HflB family protein [Babesia bovis T2Bo]|uniref:ATP-dependent metalloprotease FtsH family protein n=1 Tax=Babesia bovis TaxID=5865 RepID=A7ANF2_BABBO|nr:ATP-dependent metalloprotease FtsH/HflB family protein [Babesia bovis T2Bo]EDO08086.1 ATP-dependent metalloprotease FtsH/HflB family protein [Babesia bovis T2Bo]|eukprot:XP_001611654.1 ATP-dependent metalloprotease FtsH family protein [Babesia bovis T2Bo]